LGATFRIAALGKNATTRDVATPLARLTYCTTVLHAEVLPDSKPSANIWADGKVTEEEGTKEVPGTVTGRLGSSFELRLNIRASLNPSAL